MNLGEEPENLPLEQVASVGVGIYDRSGKRLEQDQWVIRERPVTLYLNGRELVTLLCSGHHLDELAVGFFYAEGFLRSVEDILGIDVDDEAGAVNLSARGDSSITEGLWQKRTISSGCAKGSLFYFSLDALLSKPVKSDIRITPGRILDRVEDLNHLSETYRRTHGVHNTALADPDRVVLFRDDIGRHNAVDMIVGHVFLHGIPLQDKMLITTGRLTSEMLIKAAKVSIPVVVSRNTATSLAIELAVSLGVTLIGHARGGKFTVYNGQERIDAGLSG
ncbi:MAG: formate dehydrogenase accessory sulfurtransferase FdhD [Syntrophobacteraceae bacterium]|jgi:FdhD protein